MKKKDSERLKDIEAFLHGGHSADLYWLCEEQLPEPDLFSPGVLLQIKILREEAKQHLEIIEQLATLHGKVITDPGKSQYSKILIDKPAEDTEK